MGCWPERMLDLEMPLHPQQHPPPPPQQQLQQAHAHHHYQQQPQMIPFAADPSKQQLYTGYADIKPKTGPGGLAGSDEDEADDGGAGGEDAKRMSPWQRMKWTDSMVRLLITVVYYVGGDDGGGEVGGEKKKAGGGGGGLLQKKGKWKSVSRAMMEKGFFVSPQQCEDKFNDLNKRYKRVNDIIGRGTACRVVENHSLLDSMDHISPKMKDEVRKLLNSKHLFFREMCAYHSTCAQNAASPAATATTHHSDSLADSAGGFYAHQPHQMQQGCFHEEDEVDNAAAVANEEDDEDADDEEEDEEKDEDEEDEVVEKGGKKRRLNLGGGEGMVLEQLRAEVAKVVEDGTRSLWEQREWIKRRAMEVQEQRVGFQSQALELEKQRFKWLKFSGKKERELERLRLDNERKRLEADRMAMVLRHKELELELEPRLHNGHHTCSKRPEPSSLTG